MSMCTYGETFQAKLYKLCADLNIIMMYIDHIYVPEKG